MKQGAAVFAEVMVGIILASITLVEGGVQGRERYTRKVKSERIRMQE
jgi:hypothetical protein